MKIKVIYLFIFMFFINLTIFGEEFDNKNHYFKVVDEYYNLNFRLIDYLVKIEKFDEALNKIDLLSNFNIDINKFDDFEKKIYFDLKNRIIMKKVDILIESNKIQNAKEIINEIVIELDKKNSHIKDIFFQVENEYHKNLLLIDFYIKIDDHEKAKSLIGYLVNKKDRLPNLSNFQMKLLQDLKNIAKTKMIDIYIKENKLENAEIEIINLLKINNFDANIKKHYLNELIKIFEKNNEILKIIDILEKEIEFCISVLK
jgi:hypothetical protein